MTVVALFAGLMAGSATLWWAYTTAGLEGVARAVLVLAGCWTISEWRRWRWFSPLGLFAFLALAAYGLWIRLPAGLMVIGALGGLMTWDLSDFRIRLGYAGEHDDRRGMELRHLARLLIVAVLGLILAGLTTLVRVRMSIELLIVLAVLAALGLAQLIRWIQSREG